MFSLGLSSRMSNTSKIRDSSFHQGLSSLHRVSRWMLANHRMFKFLYTLVKVTPPVLVSYIICIKQITLKLICGFNKGWFGHWKLRVGKLLFGGHSSKSLHCSICPNAQWPINKATFFDLAVYICTTFWLFTRGSFNSVSSKSSVIFHCQQAASRRREAARRQPNRAMRDSSRGRKNLESM